MRHDVQEGKENAAVFLCGGSAEHRDPRLVCGVCRARRRVLVSAPNRSDDFYFKSTVNTRDVQMMEKFTSTT